MYRFVLTAAALLVGSMLAEAARVKTWQHQTASSHDKAQFKHTVVSNEGALRLSRQLKPLADVDATHVWDIVEDRQGNLYVATGDEGKIFKVTPGGKVDVVYKGDDSQVFCLAVSASGSIFAGTGPGGRIIKIDAKGEAMVFCETSETYVWSLAFDAKSQVLYAGTGPKGRVLRISPEGKATVFYSSHQEHILCLGVGDDGSVYAGTDKSGLVYRIDAKGKGFIVFSAPQGEIRTLHVTADGIYVGTSSPTSKRSAGTSASTSGSPSVASAGSGNSEAATASSEKEKPLKSAEGSGTSSSESRESSKGSAASPPSPPTSGENSLYRIGTDGTVREIFREKAMVLSQVRLGGKLFIGTGMHGQLFEVDEASKEKSEIARLDHGQILCMLRRQDGSIILGASDPGKLYVLQDKFAPTGTVVSDVLDAKLISKWGTMTWRADAPAGTKVTLAFRSGNVAEPDDTWSDWSPEQTDPQKAVIAAPNARYLQYRVTLATENGQVSPALQSITLRYATGNQAPEVTSIDVPDLEAGSLDNSKKIKFKWNAVDPNEDELAFDLYIRKDGWKHWLLLEEGLERKDFEWDATTTPSGTYQLKVVASDRRDNTPEDALTGEKTSVPFVVSHVPPNVIIKFVGMDGDRAILEATATDSLVRLTSASFAVNGKKWVPIQPTSGLFDSKSASFRFKTESIKPGACVVVLHVRDAAANTGSGDVVFNVEEKK